METPSRVLEVSEFVKWAMENSDCSEKTCRMIYNYTNVLTSPVTEEMFKNKTLTIEDVENTNIVESLSQQKVKLNRLVKIIQVKGSTQFWKNIFTTTNIKEVFN